MRAKHWDGPPIEAWEPWTPQEAARRLAGAGESWCVVGGWALDLWLGAPTRPHADLEIAIQREGLARVRRALGLPFHAVGDGEVRLLAGGEPTPGNRHQNWVCEDGRWRLDVMLEPGDAQTWVYRRNPDLRASRAWMTGTTGDGVPYLRPQGVLFYKARAPRPKDEADLAVALPRLEPEARAWLADAIAQFEPASPWRGRFD